MLTTSIPKQKIAGTLEESFLDKRNKLVVNNLGLAYLIAKKIASIRSTGILDVDDLAQEGALGLIIAATKFDPSRKVKFCTYAVWWIRQAISRAIDNQAGLIRIPTHVLINLWEFIKKTNDGGKDIKKISENFAQTYGVRPWAFLQPVSLDKPVNIENDTTVGELLIDEQQIGPEEVFFSKEKELILVGILGSILRERELKIVLMRAGLCGFQPHSYVDIGQVLNISHVRVRQIMARVALKVSRSVELRILLNIPERCFNSTEKQAIEPTISQATKRRKTNVEWRSCGKSCPEKTVANSQKRMSWLDKSRTRVQKGLRRIPSQILTPDELALIKLRYGLGGNKEHTLQQIGNMQGVTRERIRQKVEKILKKLGLRKYKCKHPKLSISK